MAKDKKSFLLYTDLIHTIEKMPADKAGELFLHILQYVNDLNPVTDDLVVGLTFEPIKQQLKRDLDSYEKRRESYSKAGKASGAARRNKVKQRSTTLKDVEQKPTERTVSVNVSVNKEKSTKKKKVYRSFAHLEISEDDFEKLLEDYSKQQIDNILDRIENYGQNKKYKSLYLTAKSWLAKEPKQQNITDYRQQHGQPLN